MKRLILSTYLFGNLDNTEKLIELLKLLEKGLITDEEFKKQKILLLK